MDLGWTALSPGEQRAAIDGGVLGGGSVMAWYAVLGFRRLQRRPKPHKRRKRKGKGRR